MRRAFQPGFLLLLLTIVTLGCQPMIRARDPFPTGQTLEPLVSVADLASVDETPLATEARVDGTPLQVEVEPVELEPAAVEVCRDDVDDKRHAGFFAQDAWPTNAVVLTFDDGPHPDFTPRVLDLLQERKLHAAFFVVGRAITPQTYALVKRIVAEGHELGTHSYNHDVKMTKTDRPDATRDYIRAEHEVTRVLIDLALISESEKDFRELYEQVFEVDPDRWLKNSELRGNWRLYVARHQQLLTDRGLDARPYDVIYSRPPGGGPYVEHGAEAARKLHDEALASLGLVNVLWHGASGDTHPDLRGDYAYLTDNLKKYARKGGVLLIHDYIRIDALRTALDELIAGGELKAMTLSEAVLHKYDCSESALRRQLAR